MILYLDASALVKRYVAEPGSDQIARSISQADLVGTSLISRPEVAAALAKAIRVRVLKQEDAFASLQSFRKDWENFLRVEVSESVVSRADILAWEHHLRGYDSVHLASALIWQEALRDQVTMATFDQHLWRAAEEVGLFPFPKGLSQRSKNQSSKR